MSDKTNKWIKFDAKTGEMPFLHMHDLINVKYKTGYESSPLSAWSVDFDTSRDPVVAYRVVKKAAADRPIEVYVDVAEAARRRGFDASHGLPESQIQGAANEAAVRAVLKLAGVQHEG